VVRGFCPQSVVIEGAPKTYFVSASWTWELAGGGESGLAGKNAVSVKYDQNNIGASEKTN